MSLAGRTIRLFPQQLLIEIFLVQSQQEMVF